MRIDTEQIESNCKVPQTSRLSLGVLDMNDYVTALTMDTASSVSEVRLKFPKFTTNVAMGPLQLGSRDHNFPKNLLYYGL